MSLLLYITVCIQDKTFDLQETILTQILKKKAFRSIARELDRDRKGS